MADTTFKIVIPPLKAVDNGDGTYSMAIAAMPVVGGVDTTFVGILPALKAVDNGDGTYSLAGILQ